jgi:GDP/UDP-N,N'-diacetylbacillosamine 2-epimerase (hydrolysing)
MPKTVAVLTGTRADYGIYRPVLAEINFRPGLELKLIVTGMHLGVGFGRTIEDITADRYPVAAKIDMLFHNDSPGAMAKSVGVCLLGMTQALEEIKPDILLVLGDRGEMLAGALAAAHLGIVVAHIHGGEVSGSIDDPIRHAVTKFAHIHFPVTEAAVKCLLDSGELPERIVRVGAPGLDDIGTGYQVAVEELETALQFELEEKFILAVFHPVVGEADQSAAEFAALLEAVRETGMQCVLLLPNSDAGYGKIRNVLDNAVPNPKLFPIRHLARKYYLGMMARALVMIGNSSSGIIEAPSYGLTAINIGNRQQGRLRAGNVIDVTDQNRISAVLKMAVSGDLAKYGPGQLENPYRGGAAKMIADTLEDLAIDQMLLTKSFSFSRGDKI